MYIVGIAGRAYQNKDNQNIIQTHEATRKFLANKEDIVCITLLPTENKDYINIEPGEDTLNTKKLDYILDKCDAFIIPGGTYGYNFDEYIIKHAIEHDKPLLAICLGFQILCCMYAKERTKFDLTTRLNTEDHIEKPSKYKHKVTIKNNTKLKEIIQKDKIPVNSVHHDIVNFDMNTLLINAISEDGIIEGVEYPNKKFIIGLQWHPEYLEDENTNKIINAYIKAIDNSKGE